MAKGLENYIKLLTEHSEMLGELVSYLETEDILDEKLYELVDKANNLIAGPTRAYVDQD